MGVTFDLPEGLVARLEAEASRRGTTVEQLAVSALSDRYADARSDAGESDPLGAFVGSLDSGDPDWASTDTHVLLEQARSRSA